MDSLKNKCDCWHNCLASTTMSFSQLSAELLYPILHSLRADNDYLSMKACALTCQSPVSPSQTHIFHTIRIDFVSKAQVVMRTLQRYPHIRKYIQRVKLWELGKVWIGTDTALGEVLKILCSSTVSLVILRRLSSPTLPTFCWFALR